MDLNSNNRHALVTGASRGLGRAIASALAAEGAAVAAVARNLERLNELVAAPRRPRGRSARALRPRRCVRDRQSRPRAGTRGYLCAQYRRSSAGDAAGTSDAVWSQQFERCS